MIIILVILPLLLPQIRADIYMHNPRGSNNRLDENGVNRANANRLFDSQNNNRGGYLQGNMNYYTGSRLQIEWTNQHSCKNPNANCEIIIQYMCSDYVRDGSTTESIKLQNSACANQNCTTDLKYGMHEDNAYYQTCSKRSRNLGLFVADQKLRGNTAIYTRQNPNGQPYGYECAEERDYYPYWAPSPWIDVAVLTNDVKKCDYYVKESENVKSRWYCAVNSTATSTIPINPNDCQKIGGVWTESPAHNVDPPICQENQYTRDNHLGNTLNGNTPSFNWILPEKPSSRCVLRIRYNVSTNDYNGWTQDQQSDQNFIANKMKLNSTQAAQRGYVFKNNPTVKIFNDLNMNLNLAINTAQYGRIFQDRSFAFGILDRNFEPHKKVHNLNVRGKRGNIVQVYPAVEYDYVPNQLDASINDYVHIQWTGSNNNPANYDGQGNAGSDRSNIVQLKYKNFGRNLTYFDPLSEYGSYGVNYPIHLNNSSFLGFTKDDLIKLALLMPNQHGGGMDLLNPVGTYFDLGPRQILSSGVYQYMCTRNNHFSNRDQKGRVIAYDYEFQDGTFGWTGGNLEFSEGEIEIPQGALSDLTYMRVDVKPSLSASDSSSSSVAQFSSDSLGTDYLNVNPIDCQINLPLKYSVRVKRGAGAFESPTLYRINQDGVVSKVDSSVSSNQLRFESDQTGTYVLRYEKSYGVLIGVLIGVFAFIVIVAALAIFFYKNPNYIRSIRYRAANFQRSMANKI